MEFSAPLNFDIHSVVSSFKGETCTNGTFSQGFNDNFLGCSLIFFNNTKSSALEREKKSVGNLVRLLFGRKPLRRIFYRTRSAWTKREREKYRSNQSNFETWFDACSHFVGPVLCNLGRQLHLRLCLLVPVYQLIIDPVSNWRHVIRSRSMRLYGSSVCHFFFQIFGPITRFFLILN